MSDLGFYRQAVDTVAGVEQSRSGDVVVAADGGAAAVTYDVIDPGTGTVIHSGTCSDFGSYTGAYKFSFTTSNPDFQRGSSYLVRVDYNVGGSEHAGWFIFKVT